MNENPFVFMLEMAGGKATDGEKNMTGIPPECLRR